MAMVDPRVDFAAWLAAHGMKPRFAQAMARDLGISDYDELLACAEHPQVRAELFASVRDRFPFAFYAVLRRVTEAVVPTVSNGSEVLTSSREAPSLPQMIVAMLNSLSEELRQSAQRFSTVQLTQSNTINPPELESIRETDDQITSVRVLGGSDSLLDASDSLLDGNELPQDANELTPEGNEPALDEDEVNSIYGPGIRIREIKLEPGEEPDPWQLDGVDLEEQDLMDSLSADQEYEALHVENAALEDAEIEVVLEQEGSESTQELLLDVPLSESILLREDKTNAKMPAFSPMLDRSIKWPLRTVPPTFKVARKNVSDGKIKSMAAKPKRAPLGHSKNNVVKSNATESGRVVSKEYTPCVICGKKFIQLINLKKHMLSVHKDRAHPCKVCDRFFMGTYKLKIHMRSHTGERPYSCNRCGCTFKWLGNLKRHEVSKHKGKKLNLVKKSTLPSAQVMSQKVLKSKMSVKKSKANLNIASLKNKNVVKKNFSGKVRVSRKKSRSESDSIQATMTMGTTAKGQPLPWKLQRLCRYCGVSMPNRRALVLHERRHSLNLPLQCKVCGLSFEFKSYLRKHQLKHVSSFADTASILPIAKSYSCSDCKQEFAHENMLAYHRTVAHGNSTSTGTT
uniref:uncharacterized protein n=1 Tax=Myxine glutinosa TaxID=7769 RepID=UPI00358FEB49